MKVNLNLKNFEYKINLKEKKKLNKFIEKIKKNTFPEFFKSFNKNYKYSYNNKFLNKYLKFKEINIIGMGGSSLGTKAIYNFLKIKLKKKFNFFENFNLQKKIIPRHLT